MKKKSLLVMLAMMMVAALSFGFASCGGDSDDEGGTEDETGEFDFSAKNSDGITLYYNYINDGKELEVTEHYIYSGMINIPEEVVYMNRTRKVTSIGDRAFWYCSALTSVTIPNSVTTIGSLAFSHCSALTSITIPNSVTTIGASAFDDCKGLTSVTISNSVTTIGDRAFSGCKGLTSITIPNSVTTIGENAFFCDNLATVESQILEPFKIYSSFSSQSVFSQKTINNATLYVPQGTMEKYKATDGWKEFRWIKERD